MPQDNDIDIDGWPGEKTLYTEEQLNAIKTHLPACLDGSEHAFWLARIEEEARLYLGDYSGSEALQMEAQNLRDVLGGIENKAENLLSAIADIYTCPASLALFVNEHQKRALAGISTELKTLLNNPPSNFKFKAGTSPHHLRKFIITLTEFYEAMGAKPSAWGKHTKKGYSVSPYMRYLSACVIPVVKTAQHKELKALTEYAREITKGWGK